MRMLFGLILNCLAIFLIDIPDSFIKVCGKAIVRFSFLDILAPIFLLSSMLLKFWFLNQFSKIIAPALCLVFLYFEPGLPKPAINFIFYLIFAFNSFIVLS